MKKLALLLPLACALAAPTAARAQDPLAEGIALYHENRLEEARPRFEAAVRARPGDADARAWLAETARRLGDFDAAVVSAREALAIEPCHGAAHGVLGDAYFPVASLWEGTDADSAWTHIARAVECAPEDGNLWLSYWSQAESRLDAEGVLRAERAVAATGFIPPPVMAFGRWLLETAPPNAVLVMAGDWDYFPARVAQAVEGLRPDVEVLAASWLELPAYAVQASERVGVAAPPEVVAEDYGLLYATTDTTLMTVVGKRVIDAWIDALLAGRLARPVTVAVSGDPWAWGEREDTWWVLAGSHYAATPSASAEGVDTAATRRALEAIDPASLGGPQVHPTDRSPIRRAVQAPMVSYYLRPALFYGHALLAGGRLAEARAVLARVRELSAAPGLPEWVAEEVAGLEAAIQAVEGG